MQKTIILGGGIAGLMSAYHLLKLGEKVVIIDKNTNTYYPPSRGNAGLISPFGKGPFADPKIIKQMLGLYFLGKAPFVLHPKINLKTLKWFMHFFASSNKKCISRTERLWAEYGLYALDIYQELNQKLGDFNFQHQGLLLLFNNNEKDIYQHKLTHITNNDNYKNIDKTKVYDLFPLANNNICGGVLIKNNAWLNPQKFNQNLNEYLRENGVKFINEEAINISPDRQNWQVSTTHNSYSCQNLVLATGANLDLLKGLKKDLMCIPVKGYHLDLTIDKSLMPKVSTLLNGAFVVATPQQDFMRLTTKLEFNAKFYPTPKVSNKQITKILKLVKNYTANFDYQILESWAGFRPLTFNDLPIFGRDKDFPNLIYADGLGWQGNSFSPIMGKAVAEIIHFDKENIEVDEVVQFSGLLNSR
jgi:D-amino-acid dehydrogenase